MRLPRWPAFIVLLAAFVGLFVFDQRDRETTSSELLVGASVPMPVAAGDSALASTWYCAGGTGNDGGVADHSVTITNPTDEVITATLDIYGTEVVGDGSLVHLAPVETTIEVSPETAQSVRLADFAVASFTAALVELDSASVVVSHSGRGVNGVDLAPCASSASSTWSLPAGSTSRDAREIVIVFNPFPDDAVINITFATDDGVRAPQDFDGVPVPAGTLVPLDVTEVVARWDQLSVSVDARVGRVVTDRIVTFDGSEGLTGLSLSSGAPGSALVWVFPAGDGRQGVSQGYAIFNPDFENPAEVDFEVRLDAAESNGAVEPYELTIAPRKRVVVAVNRGELHPVSTNVTVETDERIPAGVGHSVTVRSFNGVPVVVEQLTTSVSSAEVPGTGVATTLGAPVTATELALALPAAGNSSVAIMNPSFSTISRVTVSASVDGELRAVQGLIDVEVGPQRRIVTEDIVAAAGGQPAFLVVTASSGVSVQHLSGDGANTLTTGLGIPVGGMVQDPELFG